MSRDRLQIPAALIAGAAVAIYAVGFHDGAAASYRLWYYVPAALAAGSFIADRIAKPSGGVWGWMLDLVVAALCLARPLAGWPPASGHAIFSLYALISASSKCTRLFAIALLLVTLYAKIWLWHWDTTLWPGLGIGLIAGLLFRCLSPHS